jgi:hypothetical protein
MRKFLACFAVLALLLMVMIPYGCTDKKPTAADTLQSDSILADTSDVDSTEDVIAEAPMPKAADELFDDFVFNFAANRRLQRKRIVFPLSVYRNGKLEKKIDLPQWKMEHFFMHQDYYTLIFDNEKQRELVKDTTIDKVTIEKIFFNKKMVQQFLFNRIDGKWMMTSINYKPMYQNQNASFLKFYQRFAVDSAFQVRSMADEVQFTAPDPNDDFSTITGVMMPQQWPDFKPRLIPSGVIYNILYGQKYAESNRKIFLIRGIANGLEMEMIFRRTAGHWKLVKFNS